MFYQKANFILAKWLKNSLTYCWPRNKSIGSLITFTIGRVCRNNKYQCIISITQMSSYIASHYVVNYPPNHSLSLPNHPQLIIKIVNSYQVPKTWLPRISSSFFFLSLWNRLINTLFLNVLFYTDYSNYFFFINNKYDFYKGSFDEYLK